VIASALVAVAAALPLAGTTVHVDAGHNGANGSHPAQINRQVPAGAGGYRKACDTTGAQTNDGRLTEATFNLDVARRLERRLARLGARVVMTRTTNDGVGPCVNERAAIGNRAHADLALSIHADGGPPGGRGFHVIAPLADRAVRPAIVAPSLGFARALRARLQGIGLRRSSYIGGGAGLVQRADLGGLNLSRVPKAFVELGNMRNAADARLLERTSQRDLMAVALARAVVAALATRAQDTAPLVLLRDIVGRSFACYPLVSDDGFDGKHRCSDTERNCGPRRTGVKSPRDAPTHQDGPPEPLKK